MKYTLILFTFLLFGTCAYGQSSENSDISFEGHWVPSPESQATFQASSLRAKLFSKNLNEGKSGVLFTNITYSFIAIDIAEDQPSQKDINRFHSAGLIAGYARPSKNRKWYFTGLAMPQLNSNFLSAVSKEDFYINMMLMANYYRTESEKLSFGLIYSSTLGFPAPMPLFNYWRAINKNWEINLGFPRLSITNHINKSNEIILFTELQGYNGNLSNSISYSGLENEDLAEKISYRDVSTGIEWQHNFSYMTFKINASYTVNRKFELQNDDYNTVHKFDMKQGFNIGVGMSFDL